MDVWALGGTPGGRTDLGASTAAIASTASGERQIAYNPDGQVPATDALIQPGASHRGLQGLEKFPAGFHATVVRLTHDQVVLHQHGFIARHDVGDDAYTGVFGPRRAANGEERGLEASSLVPTPCIASNKLAGDGQVVSANVRGLRAVFGIAVRHDDPHSNLERPVDRLAVGQVHRWPPLRGGAARASAAAKNEDVHICPRVELPERLDGLDGQPRLYERAPLAEVGAAPEYVGKHGAEVGSRRKVLQAVSQEKGSSIRPTAGPRAGGGGVGAEWRIHDDAERWVLELEHTAVPTTDVGQKLR